MSLGERFRTAREQRGLTLSDVAEQIRIRSVYLAAIEEENWPSIGAPVYIRGFLRTYARFLGLDPEDAVTEFNSTGGASALTPAMAESNADQAALLNSGRNLSPLLWVASAVALALIAFVIYLFVAPPKGGPRAVAVASPAASVSPAGSAPAAASGLGSTPSPSPEPSALLASSATLAIHLTAPSWLRVTVDGNVSIEGTFPAGTDKTFHGKSALVRVGNAGGVEIVVDGKPVGKLGATGDVAEKSFTL
ncbi:MAG TPA: RodZ domain-containing protein [Candidatus Baltobacteraceae bacterium]|jgi:cytoskeletal protein RodZ